MQTITIQLDWWLANTETFLPDGSHTGTIDVPVTHDLHEITTAVEDYATAHAQTHGYSTDNQHWEWDYV